MGEMHRLIRCWAESIRIGAIRSVGCVTLCCMTSGQNCGENALRKKMTSWCAALLPLFPREIGIASLKKDNRSAFGAVQSLRSWGHLRSVDPIMQSDWQVESLWTFGPKVFTRHANICIFFWCSNSSHSAPMWLVSAILDPLLGE